jgi:predicted fused transcriptional regulator/phosphomethylpyrimidine kinase
MKLGLKYSRKMTCRKKWDSFYSIFNNYFISAYPKVRTNIVSSSNVPWRYNDVIRAVKGNTMLY